MEEIRELSEIEIQSIKNSVQQIVDTYKILNSTLKPDVFFQRLGFLFDTLLSLQRYENMEFSRKTTPPSELRTFRAG